jgi:hypothetical protein
MANYREVMYERETQKAINFQENRFLFFDK